MRWGFWPKRGHGFGDGGRMTQGTHQTPSTGFPICHTPGPAPAPSFPSHPSPFPWVPWLTGSPAKSQLPRLVWIPTLEVMGCSIVLPDNSLSLNPCWPIFLFLNKTCWIRKECLFQQEGKQIFTLFIDIMVNGDHNGPSPSSKRSFCNSWKQDFKGVTVLP